MNILNLKQSATEGEGFNVMDRMNKDFPPFCQTPYSREFLRNQTDWINTKVPPFDREGFYRDMDRLMKKDSTDLNLWFKTFETFIATYLFPSSALSLVLFNRNLNTPSIYSGQTEEKKIGIQNPVRSLEDWALDNPKSVASYAQTLPPYTFIHFLDCSFTRNRVLMQIPIHLQKLMDMPVNDEKKKLIQELQLLNTEVPVNAWKLIQSGNDLAQEKFPNASGSLVPLWYGEELQGMLFVSFSVFNTFSSRDTDILPFERIYDFQKLMLALGMKMKEVRENLKKRDP